ncbi:septum formation initiator family protein [Aeromicrobium sp. UC242_57]|uniref:septum formation initiator family protein n=1 Tax=Aeromicrobium sp. UC242_57 TaxID=3374624 RepID=UPI00378A4886
MGGSPTSKRGPSGQRGGRPAAVGASTATTPAPAKSGRRLTTRAVVLMAVVLLLLASYTSTLHAWWEQRSEIQATKAEIAMRKQTIADLEDQKERWDDPAFVKQQAKERFGWVSPGEVGYRVIGSDGKVQGDAVPTLDVPTQAKAPQWYDKLWGSVEAAGKEPEAPKTNQPDPDKVLKDQ